MASDDTLLAVAALLGVAAYILTIDEADASMTPMSQADATSGSGSVNGFANNNPGNLVYISGDPFNGQTGSHNGFGVYDTTADGVRAMGLTLSHYYNSGLTSVGQIVTKYAPPASNNTAAYIDSVCGITPGNPYALGVSEDEPITWPEDRLQLVMAMIWQEQGSNPLVSSDVATWLNS